jgi:hypothetical protein
MSTREFLPGSFDVVISWICDGCGIKKDRLAGVCRDHETGQDWCVDCMRAGLCPFVSAGTNVREQTAEERQQMKEIKEFCKKSEEERSKAGVK